MIQKMMDFIFWLIEKVETGLRCARGLLDHGFSRVLLSVGGVFAVMRMAYAWQIVQVNKLIGHMTSLEECQVIDGASLPESSSFMDYLELANYVFPLSELMAYAIMLCNLWILCMFFRYVRGLIKGLGAA